MEMVLIAFLILLGFASSSEVTNAELPENRIFKNCSLNANQNVFEALPGAGWDNLRNVGMGQVYRKDYDNCLTSEDGRYLFPDAVTLEPLKQSKLQLSAELFQQMNEYTSMTSRSINVEMHGSYGWFSASGSLSDEFMEMKLHLSQDKSVISRVSQTYAFYEASMQPASPLHPTFLNRLLAVAQFMNASESNDITNNTRSRIIDYLCDLIIRDYGTHVVTGVTAGASLVKVDHFNWESEKNVDNQVHTIKYSASASFGSFFGGSVEGSNQVTTEQLNQYQNSCSNTLVYSHGGPPISRNLSLAAWESNLMNNLVAIDRHGDPLNFAISPDTVPLKPMMAFRLADRVKAAINRYFVANTVTGCTDFRSSSFDYLANIDSGKCEYPINNYTLGGIYQYCDGVNDFNSICGKINQPNPATGAMSCPINFNAIQLLRVLVDSRVDCSSSGFWFWKHTSCTTSIGFLNTFWCAPKPKEEQNGTGWPGYIMGGMYSDNTMNVLTNGFKCPQQFSPIKFGLQFQICLGVDTNLLYDTSLPQFGGFYSCISGNPLSEAQGMNGKGPPAGCATGFSQLFGFIDGSCEVNYCVKIPVMKDYRPVRVKRPPFIHLKYMALNNTVPLERYVTSISKSPIMKKDTFGGWSDQTVPKKNSEDNNKNDDKNSMSALIICIAVLGTCIVGLLTVDMGLRLLMRKSLISIYRNVHQTPERTQGTTDEMHESVSATNHPVHDEREALLKNEVTQLEQGYGSTSVLVRVE